LKTRLKKIITDKTLRIVFICGAAGVALDIDHPIHFYLIPELDGRFLHTPALYFFSCIIACLLLYSSGIYLLQYLRKLSRPILPREKSKIRLGGFNLVNNNVNNAIVRILNFSLDDIIILHIRQLLGRFSRYIGQENRLARFFQRSLPRTTNFLQQQFSPKES
jgi:hypothetical protein